MYTSCVLITVGKTLLVKGHFIAVTIVSLSSPLFSCSFPKRPEEYINGLDNAAIEESPQTAELEVNF